VTMVERAPSTSSRPTAGARYVGLRILELIRETDDAMSIVFDVPEHLAGEFAYRAGQFVTLRIVVDGHAVLRSYSMSSAPAVDDRLQVTVKRVPGGVASNWLNDHLSVGDILEVSRPAGSFLLPAGGRGIVAFAAGSGITPIFSIIKSALHEGGRDVRLLFANQRRDAAIFGPALDGLAAVSGGQLTVVHHEDATSGFVAAETVASLLAAARDADVFVCGPSGFMDLVEATVLREGIDPARLHVERFTPPAEPPRVAGEDEDAGGAAMTTTTLTITLQGRTETMAQREDLTILQSARWMGLRAPSSCEAGHCASCMALVVEGRAAMRVNDALTDDEVGDGWVLTCQAVPVTDEVRVVFDP
jgi:3-ketosteroid 9alpha-monooxygenase subunit B